MSITLQGVAHGFAGNRTAMEADFARARASEGDRDTVEMITFGNGTALYELGEGHLRQALVALDAAMEVLRAAGGGAHPFPGRWALVRTVLDDGGAEARAECRVLDFDTAMSRATLGAADAVAAGREGGDAASCSPPPMRHWGISKMGSCAVWLGCWWLPVPTGTGGESRRHGCGSRWPASRTSNFTISPASADWPCAPWANPYPAGPAPRWRRCPGRWRRGV